ncbi:MAG: hypothetical protein KDA81_16530 [Planctomycetaceae bacterium]|nr:hypothetical protein [Planctomycetaceae bacterium]
MRFQSDTLPVGGPSEESGIVFGRPTAMAGHSRFDPESVAGRRTTSAPTVGSSTSAPTARLMLPSFEKEASAPGSVISASATASENATAGNAASATSAGSNSATASGVGGYSLGFDASQVRAYLNRQSLNEMSQGNVLADQTPVWKVIDGSAAETPETPASTGIPVQTATAPVENSDAFSTIGFHGREKASPEGAASETSETPPRAEESSVFDRLKGLYPSQLESNSRRFLRRPFDRLSPWNVFRDREETAAPETPQPEAPADVTAAVPADGTAPNVVVPVPGLPTDLLLNELIELRVRELKTWPRTSAGALLHPLRYQQRQKDLRLLYLIADQPGEAISVVESLPSGEQDFWQQLMLGLAQYRSTDEELSREQQLTNVSGQIRSATMSLTPYCSLRLRRVDLCSRILSFGRIEPFPSNDFDPGQPVLLYAEVDNFASEITPNGNHRTSFDAQIQILHEDGPADVIETINLAEIDDEASSERLDYFLSFELTIPSHLGTGTYRIRLRVRDRISGRTTEEFVTFQVR